VWGFWGLRGSSATTLALYLGISLSLSLYAGCSLSRGEALVALETNLVMRRSWPSANLLISIRQYALSGVDVDPLCYTCSQIPWKLISKLVWLFGVGLAPLYTVLHVFGRQASDK